MVKLAVRQVCLWVGLACAACGGGDVADGLSTPVWQFALTATSTDETRAAVRSESAALSVEEAWVSLRSFEIVPCSSDSASIAQSDRPIDLAREFPELLAFESGVPNYCTVRLAIAPSPSAEPAELALHVRGVRSDGVAFEVRSELELEVELGTVEGAPLPAKYLAVGFDLAAWVDGAGLEDADVVDDVVSVDAESNAAVLDLLEANTANAFALYEDADRDGLLDADELEAIAPAARY